jgi:thymidine kinase
MDLKGLAALLIDEAQFLTHDQVFELGRVASLMNVAVVCFGLRTSWQGNVFEGSSALLGIADELRDIKTLCSCGKKATMALRVGGEKISKDEDIGQNKYVSVCMKCWFNAYDKHQFATLPNKNPPYAVL